MQGGHSSNLTKSKFEDAAFVAKAKAALLHSFLVYENFRKEKQGTQLQISSIKTPHAAQHTPFKIIPISSLESISR